MRTRRPCKMLMLVFCVIKAYEMPHDPAEPVVCLDEKPVTLHADVRPPASAKPGREARHDNEYERRGTANVFCIVEPKGGRHFTFATPNRSAFEFARVICELAMQYRDADTSTFGSSITSIFTASNRLPMLSERKWVARFGAVSRIHFTPKHGSWLNQAEIEIGLFARQCLGKRRIPDLKLASPREPSLGRNLINGRSRCNMRTRRPCKMLMLVFVCSLFSCSMRRNPAQIPKPGFNLFSRGQDIEIGKAAAERVAKQHQIASDQRLQDYIASIGKRLASRRLADNYPYSFKLINAKKVNAFALPGGPVFVFSGLVDFADNEAQIAGVLSHEISHVALRHGTNQLSKTQLFQLPALLAGAALGSGTLRQIVDAGWGLGLNGLFLRYSRDDESQADALGARIMAAAGYDPVEMARFFERLENKADSGVPEFLSDHPSPGNRADEVSAVVRTLAPRSYRYRTGKFAWAKQRIHQLPAPPSTE